MVCYLLCTKCYLQLFFDLTRAQLGVACEQAEIKPTVLLRSLYH